LGEAGWQRITGRPLVGDLAGRQLTVLPAEIVAFSDFYFVAVRDAADVDEGIRYWLAEAYVASPNH